MKNLYNNKFFLVTLLFLTLFLFANVSSSNSRVYGVEKHFVQVEVDPNYPCYLNDQILVCPSLKPNDLSSWADKVVAVEDVLDENGTKIGIIDKSKEKVGDYTGDEIRAKIEQGRVPIVYKKRGIITKQDFNPSLQNVELLDASQYNVGDTIKIGFNSNVLIVVSYNPNPVNGSVYVYGRNYWFSTDLTNYGGLAWLQFNNENFTLVQQWTNQTFFYDLKGKYNGSFLTGGRNLTVNSNYSYLGNGGINSNGSNPNTFIVPKSGNLSSNFSFNSTGLTVATWVKTDDLSTVSGGSGDLISHYVGGSVNNRAWSLRIESNRSSFRATSNGVTAIDINGSILGSYSNWTHLVATYNGTGSSLYQNGIFVSGSNFNNLFTPNITINISFFATTSVGKFNGSLDESFIMNRSLSSLEVLALYNNNTIGNRVFYDDPSTVLYYSFDTGFSANLSNITGGTYPYFFGANGTDDAVLNFSNLQYYTVLHIYPYFTNISVTQRNNSDLTVTYNFTVTVQNTTGRVWLQLSGINYTATNTSTNNYLATVNNIPIGTATYFWGAESPSGGINTSDTQTITYNNYYRETCRTSSVGIIVGFGLVGLILVVAILGIMIVILNHFLNLGIKAPSFDIEGAGIISTIVIIGGIMILGITVAYVIGVICI